MSLLELCDPHTKKIWRTLLTIFKCWKTIKVLRVIVNTTTKWFIYFSFLFPELNITVPYFTLNSYMALPQPADLSVRTKFILDLRFKSDTGHALLFYVGHSMNNVASGDFLSISIWNRWVNNLIDLHKFKTVLCRYFFR